MSQLPTLVTIKDFLKNDKRVKVAGIDVDGILRGKVMATEKFLTTVENGFGFCSVVFGWDMLDRPYQESSKISSNENGFGDIVAKADLSTFRRIPWEDNIPFFLLDYFKPSGEPLEVCPRGTLKRILEEYHKLGYEPMCGAEFEWFNFKETPHTLLRDEKPPTPLTTGMFGYSVLRPSLYQDYFYGIFDECKKFDIPIEAIHTETGPGVYEVALQYSPAMQMADRATLFKTSVKQLGLKHGIMPTFMAKPNENLPGCSGHLHFSLRDVTTKKNLFSTGRNATPDYPETAMTDVMKRFLAGILNGLGSIMPCLAPTVNSYKRLVENYWAPVVICWGYENRTTAVRVISPPTCGDSATRIEVRVPGADINPYLAIASLLACGLDGIRSESALPFPATVGDVMQDPTLKRLSKNLRDASTRMLARDGTARRVLGDAFVEHYAMTRLNEARLFEAAVTSWEVKRYFETV